MKRLYKTAPARHIILLISGAVICLFHIFKHNSNIMAALAEKFVRPLRMTLSFASSAVSFSVAEILIALAAAALLIYLVKEICGMFTQKIKGLWKTLYRILLTAVTVVAAIYAGFCLLWGIYYYGDDFVGKSGLKDENIAVEQLEAVTNYFANLADEYSGRVRRDYSVICEMDREVILDRSDEIYREVVKTFPCLKGPDVKAKGIKCSEIMSLMRFTGFYFPFTAEANVNMKSPSFMLPVTVAHELAHCRGVAKEQEANFVAIIACMRNGNDEYVYSASLMAYDYLAAALKKDKYDAWQKINGDLNNDVKRDLAADNYYWSQYKTAMGKTSDAVYEGFLKSYDQELGLKSYGACVDLLVNYYYPMVKEHS